MRLGAAAILLLLTIAFTQAAAALPESELSVRIVASDYNEKTGRSINAHHFHVVITNVSNKPIILWKEWCSWGYFNLSFEATDEGGKKFLISKQYRGWDKNFPADILISPGDHFVYEVNFDPSIWQNIPPLNPTKGTKLVLKALFHIDGDEEATKAHVWKGSVTSTELPYTLW